MTKLIRLDSGKTSVHIGRDLSVAVAEVKPGPPERIDGLSVSLFTMESEPPHNGEMHPDGDEVIYVISGRICVRGDSGDAMELTAGEACIVPKGEWHKVELLEKAQLLHITPGPNFEYR